MDDELKVLGAESLGLLSGAKGSTPEARGWHAMRGGAAKRGGRI